MGSISGCRLLFVVVALSTAALGCQSYARFSNSWVAKMVDCDGGSSLSKNVTEDFTVITIILHFGETV